MWSGAPRAGGGGAGPSPPAPLSTHPLPAAPRPQTGQPGDSAGQKLGGALLNAVIFVAIVAGMTFVLFFLFKYRVRTCGLCCRWQVALLLFVRGQHAARHGAQNEGGREGGGGGRVGRHAAGVGPPGAGSHTLSSVRHGAPAARASPAPARTQHIQRHTTLHAHITLANTPTINNNNKPIQNPYSMNETVLPRDLRLHGIRGLRHVLRADGGGRA